jgi:MarR family transcriptional regulator, organic hydroperoxide resistance regulator
MMDERNEQIHVVTQKLRIILKDVQANSKRVEKTCGLSSAKLWMLREVDGTPGIKVSQLALALSIHPSTCSNMLDKLEKNALVYRDRNKADQRSVHLYVTEEGRQVLVNNAPKPTQGKLSNALEQLSPTQLIKLESGLDDLVEVLRVSLDQVDKVPVIPGE